MKQRLMIIVSVISSIVASLCCIGPLLAGLLGLGAFGLTTWFEHWRSYFLALTFVFFSLAFFFTYRQKDNKASCADDACAKNAPLRNKIILWVAALAVLLLASFPYYSAVFTRLLSASNRSFSSTQNDQPSVVVRGTDTTRTQRIRVEGMTCGGCAESVRQALTKVNGVISAKVSLERKEAVIEYDSARVTPQQLVESINHTGFTASLQ